MAASTPKITSMLAVMASGVAGLRVAGGYHYDWGTVNNEDEVQCTYPAASIMFAGETRVDNTDMSDSGEYTNRVAVQISSTNLIALDGNPFYKVDETLAKMLWDLKRYFLKNFHLTGTCELISYVSSTKEAVPQKDILLPARLLSVWSIRYCETETDLDI